MPIYEYGCMACGCEFEVLQSISEADPAECRECGEPALHRKISAAAFHLKGTGWYETDFKNKAAKKDSDAKGETKESKPDSEAKSKESKPSTKDKSPKDGSSASAPPSTAA